MFVAELIAKLLEFPQDLPVVVDGYEDGLDDIDTVELVDMGKDDNWDSERNDKITWYYGKHVSASIFEESSPYYEKLHNPCKAIHIH